MTYNGKAAYAARNCQSNDIEEFDDAIDFLSEKVHSIVRILIPDGGTRVEVMAWAFAKSFFDEAYTGEPFDDIELAKDMAGECLAGIIIDNNLMLYSDFCEVYGNEDPDDESLDDDGPYDDCDRNLWVATATIARTATTSPGTSARTDSSAESKTGGVQMTDQYELIPTSKQRGSSRPQGWVQLAPGMNPKRRKSVGNKRVDIDEKAIEIISRAYHEFKDAVYEDNKRSCESKIVDASEFGYVKVAVIAPELDENGNVKTNKRGSVVYDKSKNDTESVPIGKVILDPKKDLLKDPVIKKTIEDYMDREVRPYVKYAEIDPKKSKVGFEIPFTRHFYKYTPPRPSKEIRAEIAEINAKIVDLMGQL